ncbi:MAG: hypothetical protein MJY85_01290 [Fibrobacter sp.]|nr:hypothetical protein [Fibrobacter sp.]
MAKKVFVFCPNDSITGGPDALHQMVFYLNKSGLNAEIVYFAFSSKHHYSVPEPYKIYVSSFLTENLVVDSSDAIVILPESAVTKLKLFKNAKVFIWWLSVDNNINRSSFFWKLYYFATLPARVVVNWDYYRNRFSEAIVKTIQAKTYSFEHEFTNVDHICASHYAYDFVSRKSSKKVSLCIEPISKHFLEKYYKDKTSLSLSKRSDIILYNPKKCEAFVQQLAAFASDLTFEPLIGLSQEQLIEKYKKAKLYVDFGPFPGAERIPKEAVLFGCSIITGRRGASNFYGDVPIPDEYKFADYQNQKEQIVKKIREILADYDKKNCDFNVYRETVLNLEQNFEKSLKENFQ